MAFPWHELGLVHVWLDLPTGSVLYDLENNRSIAGDSKDLTLPRFSYSEDDASQRAGVIDLRQLALALLPTLSEHGLSAVCAHYGIAEHIPHLSALVSVLEALLSEALHLDREVLSLLSQLLRSPLAELLTQVLVLPRPEGESDGSDEQTDVTNEVGETHAVPSVREALAVDGPIARSFPSFVPRDGQNHMADAVDASFRGSHAALVEAGPGTGKTFAYLIPAILHLQRNPSDRVLVSTKTRQLQEQLFGKDLPFLIECMKPGLRVALLKGRENYLCLRRWQALIAELTESLEQDVLLPLLAPLVRWMMDTETGDIEENSAFQASPEARSLWRRLCDSPHHCTGAFCPFGEDCYSVLARRKARRADLVVVNHSLLLGDLSVDGVVLGKYTHLIVDEAHTLEPVARMAFTRQLTERSFLRLADDLSPVGRRRGWLQRTPLSGGRESARRIEDLLSQLRAHVGTVFRQLGTGLPDERRAGFDVLTDWSEEAGETPLLLAQLEHALDAMSSHVSDDEPIKELEGFIRVVQGLNETVATMSSPPSENMVHWYERNAHSLVLHATPLDVAPLLEQLLYPKLKALVLTSATLSLGGKFDYLCRSVGLSEDAFAIHPLIAESPFAFEERMRILVPRYVPPAHGALLPYAESLAEMICDLSTEIGKNGLALFTSYAMMQAVKANLPETVPTLVQGELSRTALIDQFRRAERPMWLLGTESFWEGVDFPGEELEVLLITRLPFPVPTDPVLAAMGERLLRAGRDAFMDLALPLAGLKLRQGVGRLIRTTGDRGLVFVTDQRIVTRGYGKLLASSLPVQTETMAEPRELLTEARQWFDPGFG